MENWLVDKWQRCYPSKWKGKIVDAAIAHPAKFSSVLISRIYQHMIAEGWLQAGDVVIDPFGGVALGALDAMRLGLRWRGVELEPRFAGLGNQNIALWNSRFSRMPNWSGDAVLIQGDSRRLIEILQSYGGLAAGAASSPPYADSIGKADKSGIDWSKQADRDTIHPHGWNGQGYSEAAGAVSSPPYAETTITSSENFPDHGKGPAAADLREEGGSAYSAAGAVASPPYSADGLGHAGGFNEFDAEHHLYARMQGNSYSGSVASPPYSERHSYNDDRTITAVEKLKANPDSKIGGIRIHDNAGQTPGQLGAMKGDGFDAAVASPPFRQQSGGTNEDVKLGRGDPNLIRRHAAGNAAAKAYGEGDGQLANMRDGDLAGAVSSPPYEAQQVAASDIKHSSIEARKEPRADGNWEGYNRQNEANLGSAAGDSFWMAARQIVDQVYALLRPGGHAVWVVKSFVKDKAIVDFPDQWRQICEAAGFQTVHEHHAMLVIPKGISHTLDGGTVEHKTEAKSFFRRLAESKGAPRIDYEVVWCMVKPE